MSCVTFLTPYQRARLTRAAETAHDGEPGRPVVPEVTDGTRHRVRTLAASPDPIIRAAAASRPTAPAETLTALAVDPVVEVRCSVARNSAVDTALLEVLATDAVPTVRGWVAAHPRCPTDVLDRLAADEDPTVRSVVAWARAWDASPTPAAASSSSSASSPA